MFSTRQIGRILHLLLVSVLSAACAGVAPKYDQPTTIPDNIRQTTINIEAMRQISQAVMVGMRPRRVYFLMPRLRWTLESVLWVGKPLQLSSRTRSVTGIYGGLTADGQMMMFEHQSKVWKAMPVNDLVEVIEPRAPRIGASIGLGSALGLGFGALTGALPPPEEPRSWERVGVWSAIGLGMGIGFGALFGWLSGGDRHHRLAGAENYRRLVIRHQIWPPPLGLDMPKSPEESSGSRTSNRRGE